MCWIPFISKTILTVNVNTEAMPLEIVIINKSKPVIDNVTEVKVVGKPTKVSTFFVLEDETFREAFVIHGSCLPSKKFLPDCKKSY